MKGQMSFNCHWLLMYVKSLMTTNWFYLLNASNLSITFLGRFVCCIKSTDYKIIKIHKYIYLLSARFFNVMFCVSAHFLACDVHDFYDCQKVNIDNLNMAHYETLGCLGQLQKPDRWVQLRDLQIYSFTNSIQLQWTQLAVTASDYQTIFKCCQSLRLFKLRR